MASDEPVGHDESDRQRVDLGDTRRAGRILKRLIPLGISLLILGVIYWKVDLRELMRGFARSEPGVTLLSLSMVIPITLLTAWRLQLLIPQRAAIGFVEANRLILAASSFNVVLPAKMGEIAKAYFMTKDGAMSAPLSFSIVIVEKMSDTLSLLLWCAFGLAFYPKKDALFWTVTASVIFGFIAGVVLLGSRRFARVFLKRATQLFPAGKIDKLHRLNAAWGEMQDFFWADKIRLTYLFALSLFIWFLHLLQIWFFILGLRAFDPFVTALALAPLAIFAGLLPLTFAGIGTRDAALIFLFRPYLEPPTAAALGVLCTARYLIPAIAGLPFLHHYLEKLSARPKADSLE
jgi:uncharacterized protein (TIRG00374 family)